MSQSTTYTCNRCNTKSTSNSDWLELKAGWSAEDYCPSCVRQLVALGIAAEVASKKAAKEAVA